MRLSKLDTKLLSDGQIVVYQEWSKNFPDLSNKIARSDDIYEVCKVLNFEANTEEHLYMFCLNKANMLKSFFELSVGTVDQTIVDVRSICQKTLLANAVSVILVHNHPSGDPTASKCDILSTEKVIKAMELLNVGVLDHIIIGRNCYQSMFDTINK